MFDTSVIRCIFFSSKIIIKSIHKPKNSKIQISRRMSNFVRNKSLQMHILYSLIFTDKFLALIVQSPLQSFPRVHVIQSLIGEIGG